MLYAVQLDVDAVSQAALSELDRRLAALTGLTTVGQLGGVHHVSLGVYHDTLSLTGFVELSAFAASLAPVPLRLASIGIFSGPQSALFLAPVVSTALLATHQRFHEAFSAGSPHCWTHYRPGQWVPHVALAVDIEPESLPAALAIVAETWQAQDVVLDRLRLIEARPVRTLSLHRLARSG